MKKSIYKIRSKAWPYPGMDAWRFLTLPIKQSNKITKDFKDKKRGWGSLPVIATIRKTKWKTSIFPDKQSGTYLLPLKAAIRKAEDIYDGDIVTFTIEIKA